MADCADNTDEKIAVTVALGRAKIEWEIANNKLKPVVFEDENGMHGVCHWCDSTIQLGQLFCTKDPHDDGMCCSESWDHDHKRRKDTGT